MRSSLRIDFASDGLEGELGVTIHVPGEPKVDLENLVHGTSASRLSLRRIGRRATSGMLEARLQQVASMLETEASELLELHDG